MESPTQVKGLKQAQLCFKMANVRKSFLAPPSNKRKRNPSDSQIGLEAKALKINDSTEWDVRLCSNVDKLSDCISGTEIGVLKKSNIAEVSNASESQIISNCGVQIVFENADECAGDKSVNSSSVENDNCNLTEKNNKDSMNCSATEVNCKDNLDSSNVTEENCDTSVLTTDGVSDRSTVSVSSSDDSSPAKGFSPFNSSEVNVISKSSGKHPVESEGEEASAKNGDHSSVKKDSVEGSLLDKQRSSPTDEKPRKRRKKMTPEEALLRATQREKKIKEREIQKMQKKRELEAKIMQKKLLHEQKLMEREKLKQEKRKKKEQEENERKEREKQKQEKKEQEEKERQQKLLEKEEKNRLKQQLLEAKMEEKKKKEEQRLKVIEEKKKAEQNEEKKFEKTKAAFANYFLKNKAVQSLQASNNEIGDQGVFRPFQVKENMQLAPMVPDVAKERFNKTDLDQSLKTQEVTVLYLDTLRSGMHLAIKHKKTRHKRRNDSNDDDVVMLDCKGEEEEIVVDNIKEEGEKQVIKQNLKAKLLQFSENVRPPYWGTWRRKSEKISPRTPLARDEIFDYDVDSDDEWDEGGPGESLSGTEDEESEDDYEVDNEFFVPHGYLSADEEKDDDLVTNNPELHKARLKMKEREFESERSKKTTILRPCLIGCFWQADNVIEVSCLLKPLSPFAASVVLSQPITTNISVSQASDSIRTQLGLDKSNTVNESPSPKAASCISVKRAVPEEGIPFLIRLLHANTHSRQTVIKEFLEFWSLHCCRKSVETVSNEGTEPPLTMALSPACNEKLVSDKEEPLLGKTEKISKRQMELTIQKICVWCRCPDASLSKFCWWVHEEVRKKYGLDDLPVPNKWDYVSKKDTENTKPVSQSTTPSIKAFLHP